MLNKTPKVGRVKKIFLTLKLYVEALKVCIYILLYIYVLALSLKIYLMAAPSNMTRDDFKRKKELDDLRKAGAAPAEVDSEGNMINPHIPKYMAEAPC